MSFGGSYESGDGKEHENGPNRKEHEPEARDLHNAQDVSNPDKKHNSTSDLKHRIISPTKTVKYSQHSSKISQKPSFRQI